MTIYSSQDEFDIRVRYAVYAHLVERGITPRKAELAESFGVSPSAMDNAFKRLATGKALVLQQTSGEILMAEPFSAVPTPFVVDIDGLSWWGNCIWDGLGIAALFARPARLVTSCGDCGESLVVEIQEGKLALGEGIAHYAVPARDWWRDVVYT